MNTLYRTYFPKLHKVVYQLSRGKLMGGWGNMQILMLTTTGHKSGQKRSTPLLYLEEDGRVAVVASNGGADHHPAWYRNLCANPAVEAQIGTTTQEYVARNATDEEYASLWEQFVAIYADYEAYKAQTTRRIPIVLLEPR